MIQNHIIAAYCIQVLLPWDKIDNEIIQDLQLIPVEYTVISQPIVSPYKDSARYDSIKLVDRLLAMNQTSLKLKELQIKAKTEGENTW